MAKFYGFPTLQLPREEFLWYLECMTEVEALEELKYRNWQVPLSPERARELVWLTTKNPEAAERAWAKQLLAQEKINQPFPTAKLPTIPPGLL